MTELLTLEASPMMSDITLRRPANLWHNRNFNIFWAGQTCSALGDAFVIIAMPLLVLQATGSVAQMGIVTAIWGLGQLVAGIFSGIIVDRVNRQRLMIGCDIGRTLLYATIPLGWALAGPQIWLIYLVTLLGSCLGNCFQVSYITAVANLVDRDMITEANGRLGVTQAVTFTAGPMLAGIISGLFGPTTAIGVDSASFALSALSLVFVRLQRSSSAGTASTTKGVRGFIEDWLEGLRFLMHQPVLRSVTIIYGLSTLIVTAGLDLFIFHIKHDMAQDDNTVGIILGLASVGNIVSGILVGRMRRSLGFGICYLGGMALSSLALASIGLAPAILIVAPLAMAFTFADSIKGIASMSLRQQITPDHMLGRVTAVFWMLLSVPGPIGATIATLLAENVGAPVVLIGMGIFGTGLAVIGILTPARTRFPEKEYMAQTA